MIDNVKKEENKNIKEIKIKLEKEYKIKLNNEKDEISKNFKTSK